MFFERVAGTRFSNTRFAAPMIGWLAPVSRAPVLRHPFYDRPDYVFRGWHLAARVARHMMSRMKLGRCAGLFCVVAVGCGSRATSAVAPTPTVGNSRASAAATDNGELTSATTIEIADVRSDLGCMYEFAVHLTRHDAQFAGTAEFPRDGARVPTAMPMQLPLHAVAALQQALRSTLTTPARDTDGHTAMMMHTTDDSPSGSMTFSGPAGTYRLHFDDQFRKLKLAHNSVETTLDLTTHGEPSAIWQRYQEVLRTLGLPAWADIACKL